MENYISLAITFLVGVLYVILAFRKGPHENRSLNGSAVRSYAEAAKITGEEILRLREELNELQEKAFKPVSYHLDIIFTISDEPSIGEVTITQLAPEKKVIPPTLQEKAVA